MITKELVTQLVSAVADPDKVPPYQNDLWTLTTEEMQAFAEKAATHGAAQRDAELMGVEPIGWESLLGAIARGWCHEANANKSMDVDLANAVAKEVDALYATQLAAARLQGERITELEAALRQARDALDVATDSLGSFTMDHGSSQVDFDNIDTALAALCKLNQILK